MVSTRGVKFKFSENEKVLCYEPDPTKAKVLYDSKVLELNVSRDNRGRKVPEYLIHFYGWSSSWDRWVKEEFILPDTEENRNLQVKLAKDAALFLKGRHKVKLPPVIKETLCKKESPEETKEPTPVAKAELSDSSSASESSDSEVDKPVYLEIPQTLKEVLEEDWFFITQKDQVFKLPCEKNVIAILESYLRHLSLELLSAAAANSLKNDKEFTMENAEDKIHFCKEVMDGLRVYFDFTLPHLLLYRQEKKQFYTVGNTCSVASKTKRANQKASPSESSSYNANHSVKEETRANIHSPTRGGLRNQASSQKSPTPNEEDVNDTSPRQKGGQPRMKKARLIGSRRGLRSSDKAKSADDEATGDVNSSILSGPESDHSPARPDSPLTPTSPSRQSLRSQNLSPVSSANTAQKRIGNLPAATSPSHHLPSSAPSVPAVTASSTNPTTLSHASRKSEKLANPVEINPNLLNDILSYKMLPRNLYQQVPAAPSLIYGGQHLLRLFVKLPELIHKMNIPRKKVQPLIEMLLDFLKYLKDKKEELFIASYIDSWEEIVEGSSLPSP